MSFPGKVYFCTWKLSYVGSLLYVRPARQGMGGVEELGKYDNRNDDENNRRAISLQTQWRLWGQGTGHCRLWDFHARFCERVKLPRSTRPWSSFDPLQWIGIIYQPQRKRFFCSSKFIVTFSTNRHSKYRKMRKKGVLNIPLNIFFAFNDEADYFWNCLPSESSYSW